MTERRTSLLATLALLAMTACWGSTFFLIKDLLDRVPTLDFLAVRFAIAGAAMLLVAPRAIARLSPAVRRHAVVLGGLYGVAQILQTAGLAHTPASVSGFITGMYVVLTPLFAARILRTRIGVVTWAAVVLATAGPGRADPRRPQHRVRRSAHARRGGALRPAHRRAGRMVDIE
ncbi:DMT family transporter [Nocardioides sp. B-3]|uniref:DMT family transporter n=1 Tax=Nocardioides sp. B-3 TaxID=2895565 RepID=UPI0021531868|nr:DMT family transporter [Nocardioides sp. B-3]UUZ59685.1 DMT family transporter [Nocardioides sp. B-3]